jgi:hypothetical protein
LDTSSVTRRYFFFSNLTINDDRNAFLLSKKPLIHCQRQSVSALPVVVCTVVLANVFVLIILVQRFAPVLAEIFAVVVFAHTPTSFVSW